MEKLSGIETADLRPRNREADNIKIIPISREKELSEAYSVLLNKKKKEVNKKEGPSRHIGNYRIFTF